MDPVCHTLVGAALAESGLKRRTGFGTATLLIGANFPDIDVLAHAGGSLAAVECRRGWTHGIFAAAVLPFVLTGCVLAWAWWRRRRRGDIAPAKARQLLLLSFVAVATHPLLDFCNVYGMRWLMPFVDRWQYADILFIVDPWIWAVLAAGVFLARRRERQLEANRPWPAWLALGAITSYIAIMAMSGLWARRVVASQFSALGLRDDARFMVAPEPLNPFRRRVVIETGQAYRFGTFRWTPTPIFALEALVVPKRAEHPQARRAADTIDGRTFLHWARFPFFIVSPESTRPAVVHIVDARFAMEPNARFGSVAVVLDGGR